MSNQEYYKVVVDDVGILEILQNEPFVASKERDLIEALKEIVNHLLHFVQGEQNNIDFPCKFTRTKEHKLCNPQTC
jgi:hypothetical protein